MRWDAPPAPNGGARPSHPAAVLTLVAPAAGPADPAGGTGSGADAGTAVGTDDAGWSAPVLLGIVLVVGLAAGAAVVLQARRRSRDNGGPESAE